MWYAAHVIMSVRFRKPEDQTNFPVWENVVLVQAEDEERAWEKAEHLGQVEESEGDDEMRWNGKPARWVFAGVRKVVECRSADDDRPVDGAEVTYSQLIFSDESALSRFVEGGVVSASVEE